MKLSVFVLLVLVSLFLPHRSDAACAAAGPEEKAYFEGCFAAGVTNALKDATDPVAKFCDPTIYAILGKTTDGTCFTSASGGADCYVDDLKNAGLAGYVTAVFTSLNKMYTALCDYTAAVSGGAAAKGTPKATPKAEDKCFLSHFNTAILDKCMNTVGGAAATTAPTKSTTVTKTCDDLATAAGCAAKAIKTACPTIDLTGANGYFFTLGDGFVDFAKKTVSGTDEGVTCAAAVNKAVSDAFAASGTPAPSGPSGSGGSSGTVTNSSSNVTGSGGAASTTAPKSGSVMSATVSLKSLLVCLSAGLLLLVKMF